MTLLIFHVIFGAIEEQQNSKWLSYCEFKGINNDILTCDKCVFGENSAQTCLLSNNNNKQIRVNSSELNLTISQRTLPYLTNSWFNYDLIYMIQNYEIITNLSNDTIINSTFDDFFFENFMKNLKIIELNNWGIEILSKNAFEKFTKLKVLRLNSNSMNTIDFSSFLTNDTNYEKRNNSELVDLLKNQLIELDLSNNKIELIKIENLMYFENLKILNLSRNHIRAIDLKLISLIAPHLQVFDVSYNFLQKFSLLSVHNSNINGVNYFYSIQLIYNYFLKDLIYINLSGNYLTNILDLFSVTSAHLQNGGQEYCNITESKDTIGYFKRNSPIHVNIKNNPWKCDCSDLSFLMSTTSDKSGQQLINNNNNDFSCLTNLIFRKLNLFSINQHHNIELIKNLNCYVKQNETSNWSLWFKNNCNSNKSIINDDQIDNDVNITSFIAPKATSTLAQSNHPSVSTNKYSSSVTKVYKYDLSSAFYWITSVCIAIVTIVCLLIAWFYCWKRYRVSRQIMLETLNSTNSSARNSSPLCRNNTARCMQRRNIYLVNSRFSEEQQQQHQQNLRTGSLIPRGHRSVNNTNRNVTGLYYISLNRDSNPVDGYSNYNEMPTSFGLTDDDPPNYYEAISTKHNTRYSLNKNRVSRNALNAATATATVTTNHGSAIVDPSSISVLNMNNNDDNDIYSANGQSTDV